MYFHWSCVSNPNRELWETWETVWAKHSIFPPGLNRCCHFQWGWAKDSSYLIPFGSLQPRVYNFIWEPFMALLPLPTIWFLGTGLQWENCQRQRFCRPTIAGGSHQRQLAEAPQVPVHLALTGAIDWQGPQPLVHCPSLHAMEDPVSWLVSRAGSGPRLLSSPHSPCTLGHNFSEQLQQLWYTDLGSLHWSCWDALDANTGGTRKPTWTCEIKSNLWNYVELINPSNVTILIN